MAKRRRKAEDGLTSTELAVIMPVLIALVLVPFQIALWWHADQIADAAAREAVDAAQVVTATEEDGIQSRRMVPRRCRQHHRTTGDRHPHHRDRQRRGDGTSAPTPSRIRLAGHRPRRWSDRTIHPGARPMTRIHRDQRGAVSTELAVLTPVLIGFMLLVVFAGRVAQAEGDVANAAHEAARAASLVATPQAALEAGTNTAAANIAEGAVACRNLDVSVDTSDFAAGGQVAVTVSCRGRIRRHRHAGRPRQPHLRRHRRRGHRHVPGQCRSQPMNERGAVSTFLAVIALALLMAAGLAIDGGRKVNALREASHLADNAARTGAQAVDLDTLRTTGDLTLLPG